MKKFLLAAFIAFTTTTSFAVTSVNIITVSAQDEKTKISQEELPEAARTLLSGDDYKDWTVNGAYVVKATNVYEVELKKDGETKTVKFDKEGTVIP